MLCIVYLPSRSGIGMEVSSLLGTVPGEAPSRNLALDQPNNMREPAIVVGRAVHVNAKPCTNAQPLRGHIDKQCALSLE